MGCCTFLLYGMASASKKTVKVALTSPALHSQLRRQLADCLAAYADRNLRGPLVRQPGHRSAAITPAPPIPAAVTGTPQTTAPGHGEHNLLPGQPRQPSNQP